MLIQGHCLELPSCFLPPWLLLLHTTEPQPATAATMAVASWFAIIACHLSCVIIARP
jgi:hypothetical protein